jgi:hypothetical protein
MRGPCGEKGGVDGRSRCTALDAAAVRRSRRSAHSAARVPLCPHRRRDSATSAPGLGHVGAGTRPRRRRDSATSAPGLGHVGAGTRPRWRRDSATSAPGLGHVGAGTRPRRRRDSATSAPGLLANVQRAVTPRRLSLCVWSKTLRWTMPWFSCLCVPATSAPGLGSPLPRLRAGTGAHACHICTGTGLTPPHLH